MKKVLVGVASAALTAVICAGFVACGGSSAESVVKDAEKIVSDNVTAEQWEAAFAQENFKNVKFRYVEVLEKGTKSNKGWGKYTLFCTTSCDGANAHINCSQKAEGAYKVGSYEHRDFENEEYYETVREDGYTFEIYQANGKWYEHFISKTESTYVGAVCALGLGDGQEFRFIDNYEVFIYSDEAKGYVLKEGTQAWENYGDGNVVIKFTDGKLAAYTQNWEGEDYSSTTILAFAYGGQKVTLPKVSGEAFI